jgi:hypothetical protein
MGYEYDPTPGEGLYWQDDECTFCNADLVQRDGDDHHGLEFRVCTVCAQRYCPECEAAISDGDPHLTTCTGTVAASEIVPECESSYGEVIRRETKQREVLEAA